MSPVIHGTFTLSRDLNAPPARVFAAYAEPAQRSRWFRMPGRVHYDLDFRVGGQEVSRGAFAPMGEEERLEYHGTFADIVPGERLVFSYDLRVNDVRHWVSLVTVELAPAGGGRTRLRHTEQYVFLAYTADGARDIAHLEGGARLQLNGLAAVLG